MINAQTPKNNANGFVTIAKRPPTMIAMATKNSIKKPNILNSIFMWNGEYTSTLP